MQTNRILALLLALCCFVPAFAVTQSTQSRVKNDLAIKSGNLIFEKTYKTTISCTSPSAARTVTLPDAGANSSFLLSAGAKTIAGVCTFSDIPIFGAISLKATNSATITPATMAAARAIGLPDPGGAADIVLSVGASNITGQKTITSPIIDTSLIFKQTTANVTVTADNPAAARAVHIPDVTTTPSNFILSEGTQTINGTKSFGTPLASASITNAAKRKCVNLRLSPTSGACVDGTTYMARFSPGRAVTVTKITFTAGVWPSDGTDTLQVNKSNASGVSLLSTATINPVGLTADQANATTLTSTGADLAIPATGAGSTIYAAYIGGTVTTEPIDIECAIEYEVTDY